MNMAARAAWESTPIDTGVWLELRDERGRLMAKLQPSRLLLEVRRDGASAQFDLREYLAWVDKDLLWDGE